MIAGADISIVVQGNVRANTLRVLAETRSLFPDAELILSTFEADRDALGLETSTLFDRLVVSADPGAQPSTVRSVTAGPNNLNRQLVTTRAGLADCTRPYALKLRSDAELESRRLVALWSEQAARDGHERRLLFPSLYTRHPCGIHGYPFHVSDWLTFGRTERVQAYWAAPLMPEEVATWFDEHLHGCEATATARRFRAQMTQEQWICTHFATGLSGYEVPHHLYDDARDVVQSYRQFLARECLIADVQAIGLTVPGHLQAATSLFQRIDCVSHADWMRLRDSVQDGRLSFEPVRRLARWARRPILRGLLVRKWITGRLAPKRTPVRNP